MSFIREVIDWGVARNAPFHCHDLSTHFGCSIIKASQTIHQIRKQPKVECVELLMPNPNPKPQGADHIVAIHVLRLAAPLGKTRYLVQATPDPKDVKSRALPPLNFASLNEANSAGFVRACVTKAARQGKTYCGYRWHIREAK